MKIKVVPIGKVIPYARNPRKNHRAIDKVAASIQEFGWQQPIVIDSESVIVAGHTRYLAAQKLGLKKIPVHFAEGLSKIKIKAYRLMDNRCRDDSEWEKELLKVELEEIKGNGFDLTLAGFEDVEISKLLEEVEDNESGVLFEQAVQLKPPREYIVVMCEDDGEFVQLREEFGLGTVRRGGYRKGSPFDDTGIQRVVKASQLLKMVSNGHRNSKQRKSRKSKKS